MVTSGSLYNGFIKWNRVGRIVSLVVSGTVPDEVKANWNDNGGSTQTSVVPAPVVNTPFNMNGSYGPNTTAEDVPTYKGEVRTGGSMYIGLKGAPTGSFNIYGSVTYITKEDS